MWNSRAVQFLVRGCHRLNELKTPEMTFSKFWRLEVWIRVPEEVGESCSRSQTSRYTFMWQEGGGSSMGSLRRALIPFGD